MVNVNDDCIAQLHVCRTRVASLDSSGFIAGGSTMYVSDALAKVTIKPNIEDGDEIKDKNGCGTVYVDYKGPDSLNWYDLEMEWLTPDPYLMSLLLPLSKIITSGSAVGHAAPSLGAQDSDGISLEFWCKRVKDGALSSVFPYAHWALPKVLNMREGDKELSATAQHPIVTGQAYENDNWFNGPAQDWPSAPGSIADRAWQWIPVSTMPDAVCGLQSDVAL